MRVIGHVLGSSVITGFGPMDAYQVHRSALSYSDDPPVLIAGSSQHAIDAAAEIVSGAGLRIADKVAIEAAYESVDRQVAASAVWLEIERDSGPALDKLLERVNQDVGDGRYAAVISIDPACVDAVAARIQSPAIEVLVAPDPAERMSGLAAALANFRRTLRFSDIASDRNALRIRQLSEEVSRIASTLARLSEGPSPAPRAPIAAPQDCPVEVSAEKVRAVIRARRLRSRYFPEDLFADPAWDMLLDLLQAEICHLRVPVSSLCIAAAVPATTALRWLKAMVQEGLFIRRADPHDGRRVFVELAPHASQALRRFFNEIGDAVVV
jgi:DNA-binding MarR family transcriptional regulator